MNCDELFGRQTARDFGSPPAFAILGQAAPKFLRQVVSVFAGTPQRLTGLEILQQAVSESARHPRKREKKLASPRGCAVRPAISGNSHRRSAESISTTRLP